MSEMLDVEQWIEREFINYQYYGNPPTDIRVDCSFCGDDYKQHLHISMDKQAVHCFRCGYSSNWIGLVMDVTGLPYHLALGELYVTPKIRSDIKSDIITRLTPKNQEDEYLAGFSLPKDFKLIASSKTVLSQLAKKYLVDRGFGSWHWKRYRLGVAESKGYRVIIPIEDNYWQGRAIHDWDAPKYLNPKAEAGHVIFNSTALSLYDEIIICEGALSAMAVGENAVALIGKEPTRYKIERLMATDVEKYIIALEPDAYGTMRKLADTLCRSDKQLEIWAYNSGDPATGDSYEVMDYDLKSRILLSIQASKSGRSRG
jgi:DNA primase